MFGLVQCPLRLLSTSNTHTLFFISFIFLPFNHIFQDFRKQNNIFRVMDVMWHASQLHFHLLFIFIGINFYSLSFLCDVYNEVHEHT